jgi:hypothetical protein
MMPDREQTAILQSILLQCSTLFETPGGVQPAFGLAASSCDRSASCPNSQRLRQTCLGGVCSDASLAFHALRIEDNPRSEKIASQTPPAVPPRPNKERREVKAATANRQAVQRRFSFEIGALPGFPA